MKPLSTLEDHFAPFRANTIGREVVFESPYGQKKLIYADWTASGRAYGPIEEALLRDVLPFFGNTHTETTVSGTLMSRAYEKAKSIIKQHVNAGPDDVLLFCGSGMTGAVNKLQRILGLRMPDGTRAYLKELRFDEALRPVVFVTHMEHHSNHTSWLETIATVEVINPNAKAHVDLAHFKSLLARYKHRRNKIAAVTACSNVTGIQTPYHEIAKLIHHEGGLCFVDFAASAPYADINMHPANGDSRLDAVYFSMHKFLGGPGTPGVLIFNENLSQSAVPDQPGGGTIAYSNPWGGREYVAGIEQREDGGTPPVLQGIKAAMCIRLKEQMGVENMQARERELLQVVFARLAKLENIQVLQPGLRERLGIISFMVNGAHHNLIVKLLNDRFGIQTRGGCSCAGTYGHYLLNVDREWSYKILRAIKAGNLFCKPGWVRLSVHPTMTNAEINFIMDAIEAAASNFRDWAADYRYDPQTNEYVFKDINHCDDDAVEHWFKPAAWGAEPPSPRLLLTAP